MRNLKKLRETMKLTQAELAERIGTTQQTVARWESGKAEPNLATLRDLALILYTSVDHLLGREPALKPQTTNPFARYLGDDSGYWGNIGVRLPIENYSRWYPITTSQMEDVFREVQSDKSWIMFQTLNNRMVVFRRPLVQAVTFLDEAEDQIDGDWNVGPDDVEGWPSEVYEGLEHIFWKDAVGDAESDGFSERLISVCRDLVADHALSQECLQDMLINTRIVHSDGTCRTMHVSESRMAATILDFEASLELFETGMLHLDDNDGDHSVFLSLDLITLIEFPLVALRRGLDKEMEELDQ